MKVATLNENTATTVIKGRGSGGIVGEHGFSALIDTEADKKILFDTGQSISAVHNADRLGINLRDIDAIVLSHGHYDHTGGLVGVLKRMQRDVEVIAHPDVFQRKYVKAREGGQGQKERYVGIPFVREYLKGLGAKFKLSREPVDITKGITTTGEVKRESFEELDKNLYVKEGKEREEEMRRDEVMDDQALIIKDEKGLFIILGCAHSGMINTIEHAIALTGIDKIYGVIGGTHLSFASEKQIEMTIEALKRYKIEKIGVSHCTGIKAAMMLSSEFENKFFFN